MVRERARKALHMLAMTTLYKTQWGKHFRERLAASGKSAKHIIGAMMCKLVHVLILAIKKYIVVHNRIPNHSCGLQGQ
jgi:hypothetical protein